MNRYYNTDWRGSEWNSNANKIRRQTRRYTVTVYARRQANGIQVYYYPDSKYTGKIYHSKTLPEAVKLFTAEHQIADFKTKEMT